jgi:NAD(P)H-dependent FMN reductase
VRWAETVEAADGFVLITPEYNHGYPAALKNALDLVYAEWGRKPVAFVSYGGPAGGVRAVQQLREVVIELDLVPLRRQVAIPRVHTALREDGPDDPRHASAAERLLDDLAWWARALAGARIAA